MLCDEKFKHERKYSDKAPRMISWPIGKMDAGHTTKEKILKITVWILREEVDRANIRVITHQQAKAHGQVKHQAQHVHDTEDATMARMEVITERLEGERWIYNRDMRERKSFKLSGTTTS